MTRDVFVEASFGAALNDGKTGLVIPENRLAVGCNTVLNPGVVLGRGAWVYPSSLVRGVVPAMHVVKDGGRIAQRRTEEA